jgi:hypothetical protein
MQKLFVLRHELTGHYYCYNSVSPTGRTNYISLAWTTTNVCVAKFKADSLRLSVYELRPVCVDVDLTAMVNLSLSNSLA